MLTLKNVSSEPVANVQLNAVIRRVGRDRRVGRRLQEGHRHRRHSAGRQHETYRASIQPRIHWHRAARADAEEQPVRRRSGPGVRQARRQPVDEARRVAHRARLAHPVALRAFSDTHLARTAARPARRRRHHRRQRHRRRHPLYFRRPLRRWFPIPSGFCRRGWPAASWRSPARWHTPSWPRCGRVQAANTSTCARRTDRLPAS